MAQAPLSAMLVSSFLPFIPRNTDLTSNERMMGLVGIPTRSLLHGLVCPKVNSMSRTCIEWSGKALDKCSVWEPTSTNNHAAQSTPKCPHSFYARDRGDSVVETGVESAGRVDHLEAGLRMLEFFIFSFRGASNTLRRSTGYMTECS